MNGSHVALYGFEQTTSVEYYAAIIAKLSNLSAGPVISSNCRYALFCWQWSKMTACICARDVLQSRYPVILLHHGKLRRNHACAHQGARV